MMESVHEDCGGDCLSPDFQRSNHNVKYHGNHASFAKPSSSALISQEDVDKMIETYTQRINSLNVEILELRMSLKHEQHSMEVIREMNEKSDQELAKLIQQEREKNDALTKDYESLLEDYQFLLEEYEQLNKRKDVEMKEIIQSKHVLEIKVAEVEEENQKLLTELVQCKVDFANLSMSVDDLNAEKNDVQRLVDSYKAMISKGELVYKPQVVQQQVVIPPNCDQSKTPQDMTDAATPSMFVTQIQPIVSNMSCSSSSSGHNSLTKGKLSTDSSDPMPGINLVPQEVDIVDSTTCEEIVFV